jgi:hypothetical protein
MTFIVGFEDDEGVPHKLIPPQMTERPVTAGDIQYSMFGYYIFRRAGMGLRMLDFNSQWVSEFGNGRPERPVVVGDGWQVRNNQEHLDTWDRNMSGEWKVRSGNE